MLHTQETRRNILQLQKNRQLQKNASCRRTASCKRTASQTDETAEAEKRAVSDSKGNQTVPEQKDRKRQDSQTLRIGQRVAIGSKRVSRKATSKDAK